jgi:hypothetical protein
LSDIRRTKAHTIKPVDVMATKQVMANSHRNGRMGPSLELASKLFDLSSIALAVGACIVFIATAAIVWLGIVKEHHWDVLRGHANERIAELTNQSEALRAESNRSVAMAADAQMQAARLNRETAHLQADNLALQTVMLPRHMGIIGVDQEPPAKKFMPALSAHAGTPYILEFAQDGEAQALAKEIEFVLNMAGWKQWSESVKSNLSARSFEGVQVMYPVGKPWTAEEPVQPWMALSRAAETLANVLTTAGFGVGSYPVARFGITPGTEYPRFEPALQAVVVHVGARPVSLTIQWIKQGRPDELGNKAK